MSRGERPPTKGAKTAGLLAAFLVFGCACAIALSITWKFLTWAF